MLKNKPGDNPYLLMAVLMVFWGSFAAVSKLVLSSLDSFQTLFYFFGIAWLVLSIPFIWNGKLTKLLHLGLGSWLSLSLIALSQFLYYFFYNLSLSMIPAMEASMLNYLFPLFIVLLAVPINSEKLNASKVISLAVGFAGALLIICGNGASGLVLTNLPGDLLAVGAAFCWGLFSNLGRKNEHDAYVSFYVYTTVAFLLSAVALPVFSRFELPDWGALAGMCWMSFSNILLTYLIWFRVLRIAPAALVANLSFFTPFVTLLFIVVLLDEKISAIQLAGALVLLAGTAIQIIRPARAAKPEIL